MQPVPAIPIRKRWVVAPNDLQAAQSLSKELAIPLVTAQILAQRGLDSPETAEAFLKPELADLHDPSLLPDYDKAVREILNAKEKGDTIFIHGDYDVDGVTSASLLTRFLKSIGCKVITHVPHRMKEGYGIHESAVESARAVGAKLFLTCDCGISAHDQVNQANEAGMVVVVTDHHTVGSEIPNAAAVVNPHRPDSAYPFDELSGAGVVFKLCEGLTRELGHNPTHYYRAFLDLAALGTIADVMPLIDENRIIAKFGLEQLAKTKKVGLIELMRVAGIEPGGSKPIKAYHVGFGIGPRLNAAGRLDDAAISLDLLLESDPEKAREMAQEIDGINNERKAEQERIYQEAVQKVLAEGKAEKNVIVIASENWHSGVIGIVAGKLVEFFRRPCFVASIDPKSGTIKGSARSIPGFNLADALRNHEGLVSGGGHAMAAGFSADIGAINELNNALHDYAGGFLTEDDFMPQIKIDAEVDPSFVTMAMAESLSMLEPFGVGNPEPVFLARNMQFAQVLPTRNPSIVRLVIRHSKGTSNGVMFSGGEAMASWDRNQAVDVVFRAMVDEYNGSRSVKWEVRDFAPAEPTSLS